jgi:hypothetical protein
MPLDAAFSLWAIRCGALTRTEATADGSGTILRILLELCSGFTGEFVREVPLRRFSRLVAFGIEHDEATRDFAGRGRRKSGLAENKMKHAALSRGHRRERIGLPCGSDFLDGYFRGALEIAVARGFVVFSIERDAVVIFRLKAEDFGCNVLDSVEEFTVASLKEGSVWAG